MKKQIVASALAFLGFVFLCHAGTVSVPHNFSNGQVADAEQVNANFSTLAHAINNKGLHYQIVTGDATIGANASRIMAINTSGNIQLALPDPTTVGGQAYIIQKLKGAYVVEIVCPNFNIQNIYKSVRLTQSGRAEVFSDGTVWHLLQGQSNDGALIHPLVGNFGILKDIITGYDSSNPSGFTEMGGKYYFSAGSAGEGVELWVTDGTTAGTSRVKDINEGYFSSNPMSRTAMGSKLYFLANDGIHDQELWCTDGTEGGTMLVKDIYTNPYYAGSGITNLTAIGSKLYFTANDDFNTSAPWVSDGTGAETFILSTNVYNALGYSATNNGVAFVASTTDSGTELYLTDGTAGGTHLLVDLEPGASSPSISDLASNGSIAFFSATDSGNGQELWKTDGTAAGTAMVKNIAPSGNSSSPENFSIVDGLLYFSADDGTCGSEPWVSDGTESGTHLLFDVELGLDNSSPRGFTKVGSKIIFKIFTSNESDYVVSYDTITQNVENLGGYQVTPSETPRGPIFFQSFGNEVLFRGLNSGYYNNLYSSDGTKDGTIQIISSSDYGLNDFRAFDNFILLNANNTNFGNWGSELYILSDEPAPALPIEQGLY